MEALLLQKNSQSSTPHPSVGTDRQRFVVTDNIKNRTTPTRRIENDEFIMPVGSARPLEDAARVAFYDLVT
jgi:hypothetical protein